MFGKTNQASDAYLDTDQVAGFFSKNKILQNNSLDLDSPFLPDKFAKDTTYFVTHSSDSMETLGLTMTTLYEKAKGSGSGTYNFVMPIIEVDGNHWRTLKVNITNDNGNITNTNVTLLDPMFDEPGASFNEIKEKVEQVNREVNSSGECNFEFKAQNLQTRDAYTCGDCVITTALDAMYSDNKNSEISKAIGKDKFLMDYMKTSERPPEERRLYTIAALKSADVFVGKIGDSLNITEKAANNLLTKYTTQNFFSQILNIIPNLISGIIKLFSSKPPEEKTEVTSQEGKKSEQDITDALTKSQDQKAENTDEQKKPDYEPTEEEMIQSIKNDPNAEKYENQQESESKDYKPTDEEMDQAIKNDPNAEKYEP